MHWADKIAKEIVTSGKFKPYWVDDMKTPSGFSHVGSLLGPLIHSMIFRALKDAGEEVEFSFVINDFDPVDDLLPEIRGKYEKYLGMPLRLAPSPDPNYKSMADLFGSDFVNLIKSLGVEARVLSSWDMYHEGKFDGVIRLALDNSEKIQDIYQRVSGSKKKEAEWLPFQVICEKCQKIGTTKVFAWDGEKVSYRCEQDLVTWAKGCGHEGKISPFGGTGKLPWKVDWAAHWKVMGVTIEGAGKDHASAGGSYDIAMEICKEVFKFHQPYRLPYEFILIGGKKMSSSKGLGLKAHDLLNILPPPVARFLFAKQDIRSQSNFDPNETMAIPDLFDEYDKAWEAHDKGGDEKLARTYEFSQVGSIPQKEKGFFAPRFRDVANYLSQGVSKDEIFEKFIQAKEGKLDNSEISVLEERISYANVWLEKFAPEDFRFEMTKEVPEAASKLTKEQRDYLVKACDLLQEKPDPDNLQIALYELSKQVGISTKDAFAAIYLVILGKTQGPRAGMLLSKFNNEKIIERFKEAPKL
ncbi:lysine--tRNA ligase [Candidatus Woesebacteria bacterium]|nr:lysine--tRNA ligase [Candidatus Woesebacteria bacterium]